MFNTAIEAGFHAMRNHSFSPRQYAFGMTYGTRLQTAMNDARVDRKTLAGHLKITVQALGQVLSGKTKALDALHHTRAAAYLGCDALWLASGGRRPAPAAVPNIGEQPSPPYDPFPRGLTTAERDIVQSYRQLPTRRQAELHESIMLEARQYMDDFQELFTRHNALAPASAQRVAAVLPPRPDGDQPDTAPGTLT